MDADFLAAAGDVSAGSAHVVFHVARTQDAARIDVFKASDYFMGQLTRGVNHHVQSAAVAHGHDRGFRPLFARRVEDGVQERNQRGDSLQGKPLGAQVARLQNLFEQVGANQALEDFVLIDWTQRSFEALRDPAAALRLRQMHEIGANRVAVDAAGFLSSFAG